MPLLPLIIDRPDKVRKGKPMTRRTTMPDDWNPEQNKIKDQRPKTKD
jgi:hypothetical protein